MKFYSYKLDHDYGLAPNPFGKYCTLAVCKPSIRSNSKLQRGDWVIGTGSVRMKKLHHLIYTMQVDEILSFEKYWKDDRFQYKKPVINGSLVQMYGDNFYHKDSSDNWVQEKSAHSIIDKEKHKNNDLSGEHVLISTKFYYLGENSVLIPDKLQGVCCEARDMMYKSISDELGKDFLKWVQDNFDMGINGDPTDWSEHSQLNINI